MVDTAAPNIVLSDSMFKTRPSSFIFFRSDANAGLNSVQADKRAWLKRQMKLPQVNSKTDVESFQNLHNPGNPAYLKWNEEGEYRAHAPSSTLQNMIDPISGFVNVGWQAELTSGRGQPTPSIKRFCETPQSYNPRTYHSNRLECYSALPETRRAHENDPGTPYRWNSKSVSDRQLRAELTAMNYPATTQAKASDLPTSADDARNIRDQLALKFRYTSSTQQAYADVQWDSTTPCRRWAPVSTLEQLADPIAFNSPNKRFEPQSADWQNIGGAWDAAQARKAHFKHKQETPIPGVNFCSSYPRAQQIPGYSGCIGGENLEEIDNHAEPFQPFTVKRVNPIPPATETSHRPTIPKYTGCTNYWTPAASDLTIRDVNLHDKPTTTGTVNGREGTLARMVTLVDPCNPFNAVTKKPIIVK